MHHKTYLADLGMIASVGNTAESVFHCVRAGISRHSYSNYSTDDHYDIKLNLVPNGALPPLVELVEMAEALSFRDERLLRLCQVAATEATRTYQGAPIPLILSAPENYHGINNQISQHFFSALAAQTVLPIDYSASRIFSTGRTGVLEALKLAQHLLADNRYESVLVGGVDSCQHSEWLGLLDKQGRLNTTRPGSAADSFIPGEGAGFLLLTSNPGKALTRQGYRYQLTQPGFGLEHGHIYSDHPYQGQGLDHAVKAAFEYLPEEQRVKHIFSSMNGEHFWAKEMAVAMARSAHRFDNPKHHHPCDSYGDVGAASAAFLIGLACLGTPTTSLIYASSDHAYRAAVCLVPERIQA